MPKAKAKAQTEPEVSQETANTGTPEVQEATTSAKVKASFDIYTPGGGFVRTYSLEDHGEDAEKLANQYASKIGGSVR